MPNSAQAILAISDEIASRRMILADDISMPLLKAQGKLAAIASGALPRERDTLIEIAALIVASVQRMDDAAQSDGFNPHGSGPVEIGPRETVELHKSSMVGKTTDVGLVWASPPCRHSAAPQRRAVLEGQPTGMRADIAERCARAGFACSFLPARSPAGELHITLVGRPGAGKSALLNAIADAGYVVRERRSVKDRGEPAEAAVIYGRNVCGAAASAEVA